MDRRDFLHAATIVAAAVRGGPHRRPTQPGVEVKPMTSAAGD